MTPLQIFDQGSKTGEREKRGEKDISYARTDPGMPDKVLRRIFG